MAGTGGFKNALNGFDKNEVNQYISELSKKMQEREAELKDALAKAEAATRAADAAEAKVKSLEDAHAAKVLELEAQIKTERRNSDNFQNEIDELKRKLRNSGSSGAGAGGGASTAEAERRAAEIVENANATARDIVEKAKQTAKQITASAKSAAEAAGSAGGSGVSAESLKAFQDILGNLTSTVTNALKTANEKASGISVAAGGAPVHIDIPDFSDISAPQAAVPASRPESHAKPAPKEVGSVDDIFSDMLDNGGDMSDFGDIKPLEPAKHSSDVVDGFDLSNIEDPMDDAVTEVAPLEKIKQGGAAPDDDFAADLLAQTVPSSVLKDHLDDDMLATVREREEQFAVKPSDEESDFDMGAAESGLDAMNALLGQMGAVLESAGGSTDSMDLDLGSGADSSSADDNPWADFQNQIEALEQSAAGGAAAEQPSKEADPMDSAFDDPKVPDADDSAIWNFDDMSSGSDDEMNSGSDDDMSSDLFGSF